MWMTAHLATAFFYQGRADEGYEILCRAPASAGPFLAPNEHMRDGEGARLSWFTTGAGAVVYAIHAMFVQVDERGTMLLPALPSAVREARFERLLGAHGVRVSGEVREGELVSLTAQADRAMAWGFRMPQRLAATAQFTTGVTAGEPDGLGLVPMGCTLKAGRMRLVAPA
jgi:hypothetical protein